MSNSIDHEKSRQDAKQIARSANFSLLLAILAYPWLLACRFAAGRPAELASDSL
jgi:hypothetical protein